MYGIWLLNFPILCWKIIRSLFYSSDLYDYLFLWFVRNRIQSHRVFNNVTYLNTTWEQLVCVTFKRWYPRKYILRTTTYLFCIFFALQLVEYPSPNLVLFVSTEASLSFCFKPTYIDECASRNWIIKQSRLVCQMLFI